MSAKFPRGGGGAGPFSVSSLKVVLSLFSICRQVKVIFNLSVLVRLL